MNHTALSPKKRDAILRRCTTSIHRARDIVRDTLEATAALRSSYAPDAYRPFYLAVLPDLLKRTDDLLELARRLAHARIHALPTLNNEEPF